MLLKICVPLALTYHQKFFYRTKWCLIFKEHRNHYSCSMFIKCGPFYWDRTRWTFYTYVDRKCKDLLFEIQEYRKCSLLLDFYLSMRCSNQFSYEFIKFLKYFGFSTDKYNAGPWSFFELYCFGKLAVDGNRILYIITLSYYFYPFSSFHGIYNDLSGGILLNIII